MSVRISCLQAEAPAKTVLVTLAGEISNDTTEEVRTKLFEIAERADTENFILNFSELKFINSMGIGIIIEMVKNADKTGKKVVMTGLKDQVKEVMELIGVDKIVPVYKHFEEAIDALKA